jgi:hypothetical protein
MADMPAYRSPASSGLRTLAAGALGTVVLTAGWLVQPLRWPIENRTLRKLLQERRFEFIYDPKTRKKRLVTFLPFGTIGIGRGENEYRWQIRRGALEIFQHGGKLYSRFRYDPQTGLLRHTGEAGLLSPAGQYFQPGEPTDRPRIGSF